MIKESLILKYVIVVLTDGDVIDIAENMQIRECGTNETAGIYEAIDLIKKIYFEAIEKEKEIGNA